MIIISFVLLGISISALVLLKLMRMRIISISLKRELFYPLGRVSFIILGASVLLLGLNFFRQGWIMAAFFGTLLIIWGAQITLWAAGISLDFLANVSTRTGVPMTRQPHDTYISPEQIDSFLNKYKEDERQNKRDADIGTLKTLVSQMTESVQSISTQLKNLESKIEPDEGDIKSSGNQKKREK